jgi:hypothetical protein
MVYFPFSGSKNSFFGDLHGPSRDSLGFTRTKTCSWNAGATSSRENFYAVLAQRT